jgi:hypothetical protein
MQRLPPPEEPPWLTGKAGPLNPGRQLDPQLVVLPPPSLRFIGVRDSLQLCSQREFELEVPIS